MYSGLFKGSNRCPKCNGEPRMFSTVTTKEGLFCTKRTINHICSKCNYKWED